jgi:hypothetical protein
MKNMKNMKKYLSFQLKLKNKKLISVILRGLRDAIRNSQEYENTIKKGTKLCIITAKESKSKPWRKQVIFTSEVKLLEY